MLVLVAQTVAFLQFCGGGAELVAGGLDADGWAHGVLWCFHGTFAAVEFYVDWNLMYVDYDLLGAGHFVLVADDRTGATPFAFGLALLRTDQSVHAHC